MRTPNSCVLAPRFSIGQTQCRAVVGQKENTMKPLHNVIDSRIVSLLYGIVVTLDGIKENVFLLTAAHQVVASIKLSD